MCRTERLTGDRNTVYTDVMPKIRPVVTLVLRGATLFGFGTVGPAAAQTDAEVAEQLRRKGFSQQWVDSLTADAGPRWYTGEELEHIGLPVGGLYAGQVYLGGDGRLWYWDIFNQRVMNPGGPGDKFYNEPMQPDHYRGVSSGFVLELDDRAVLLDGRGFEGVRFRSEYPLGRVQLTDDQSPVSVELNAFSPFSPTDSGLSSMPVTVMSYTLTNTSDEAVRLRAGGWLENAGNKEALRSGALSPRTIPIRGVTGVLLSAGRAGAVVEPSGRADVPLQDFENGYGKWHATGNAFGRSPFIQANHAPWQPISGSQGKALANTHDTRATNSSKAADRLTGTLTSPAFTIERKYLSFLVAGGRHTDANAMTAVQVLVEGQVVATIAGQNSNEHRAANVDLSNHQGRQSTVHIVDSHTGGWGHIQADDFIQTDAPRYKPVVTADEGTMAIALLGRRGEIVEPSSLPEFWGSALSEVDENVPGNAGVVRSEPITLKPGESTEVRFAVAWHFPNGHKGTLFHRRLIRRNQQRNYYSKFFSDAGKVIEKLAEQHDEMVATTRLWRDTWYESTLPSWFLDRTFINASSLATTMAFRMHDAGEPKLDGRVYFWEGVYLGDGTCTHVTHYEQAFGRLFPDAARAQRKVTDYGVSWDDQLGFIKYRGEMSSGGNHIGIHHAIDGHAGTILRTYREHTTSSDDTFLRSVWPRVKRAVQFMIDQDAGRGYFASLVPASDRNTEPDGILTGPQYNTLDKTWDGVIPWTSGMYMASLRASAEMAREMGDDAFAALCDRIAKTGKIKLTERTFNKDFGYFVQRPNQQAKYVNSNDGCHIDQLLGNYWAKQAGLVSVFPRAEARSALNKLFEHNLYRRVGDYREQALIKVSRFYADDDEPGTFMCTFPHGGDRRSAPAGGGPWDNLVVGYFSENMTGFTYNVAAQMIGEGMVTEGLALCRAIHDRYAEAPLRRNPLNEIEYGNHYSRAMSSYAAYIAASGFTYHGPKGEIGFAPRIGADDFRGAFTAAEGWGSFSQTRSKRGAGMRHEAAIKLAHGALVLNQVALETYETARLEDTAVNLDGEPIGATVWRDGERVIFALSRPVHLKAGQTLNLHLHDPAD